KFPGHRPPNNTYARDATEVPLHRRTGTTSLDNARTTSLASASLLRRTHSQRATSHREDLVDLRAPARTGPAEISRAESAPGSLTLAIASRAAYRSLVAPVARDPPLGTAAVLRGSPALATASG